MDQNNDTNQTISDEQINNDLNSILMEMQELDSTYKSETKNALDTIDSIDKKVGIIADEVDSNFDEIEKGSKEYEDSLDGLVMEHVGVIEEDLDGEE